MMDNGSLLAVPTGIWLIPLIILLTLVVLYGLSLYWRSATDRDLKYLQSSIRTKASILDSLHGRVVGYERAGEPFNTHVEAFEKLVDEARSLLQELRQQYVWCQTRVRKYDAKDWQMFVGAPFLWGEWVQLRRRVDELKSEVNRLNGVISDTEGRVDEIEMLGWKTALRSREMQDELSLVAGLMKRVRVKNLRGDELEEAIHLHQKISKSLQAIPDYFLSGGEEEVLSRSGTGDIVGVHRILSDNQEEVEALTARLQSWDERYRDASIRVEEMRARVAEAEELLQKMPTVLDTSEYELRLRSMHTVSDVLIDTLDRLEISAIDEVAASAIELHRTAKEIINTLREARRGLLQMRPILEKLNKGSAEVTNQYMRLGKSALRSITWDRSRDRMIDFNRHVKQIRDIDQVRTPDQVRSDLMKARELSKDHLEIEKHIARIAAQHRQLLELLEGIEIREGSQRISAAKVLSDKVLKYHQDNWVGIEPVADFVRDINRLQRLFDKKISPGLEQPIWESQLEAALQETQSFVTNSQNLQRRTERFRERLMRIQGIEKSGREQLQRASGAFRQISYLIGSNPYLQAIGQKHIGRWQSELEKLAERIDFPGEGSVEKKASQIHRCVEQIEATSAGWLRRLNQDIQEKRDKLNEKLDNISDIALLKDPAIEKAKYLVERDVIDESREVQAQDIDLDLNELIGRLSAANKYWQSCTAVLRELEERVEKPLLEAYHEVQRQREQAGNLTAQISTLISDKRTWPPSTQIIHPHLEKLSALEEQLNSFGRDPLTPIWGVKKLGELSAEYRSLGEKIKQAIRWRKQELARIEELEEELNDLAVGWIQRERSVAHLPDKVNDVHSQRLELERERDRIKNEWLIGQRGDNEITYAQVVRELISLIKLNRERQSSIVEPLEDMDNRESYQ